MPRPNYPLIEEVLSIAPLCADAFVQTDHDEKGSPVNRYCSVSALARYAGVSAETLERLQSDNIDDAEEDYILTQIDTAIEREYNLPRGIRHAIIGANDVEQGNENIQVVLDAIVKEELDLRHPELSDLAFRRRRDGSKVLTAEHARYILSRDDDIETAQKEATASPLARRDDAAPAEAQDDATGFGGCDSGWAPLYRALGM